MQDILFYVAANSTLGECRNAADAQAATLPSIIRGGAVRLRMRLFAGDGSASPLPVEPLANCVSWEFVMDSDWNGETPLKLVADNANITIATITETDEEELEHVYTEVRIPIPDTNTEELAEYLSASETATLNGELAGYDADANLSYILQLKGFTVRNRISAGAPPTEIADRYLDEAGVRALLAAGFEQQFAETDSTDDADWHGEQSQTDEWVRSRLRGNASAAWGDSMKLLRGPQGIQGETGPQGIQGETGPRGIQGETGAQGPRGEAGNGDMNRSDYDADADGIVDRAATALNVGGKTAAEVAAAVDAAANLPAAGVDGGFAPLSGGKIPAQYLNATASTHVIAGIAARDALIPTQEGERAFVRDASADSTVTGGAAEYIWDGSAWVKIAEAESLDLILDWGNLQNKPGTFPPSAHSHDAATAEAAGFMSAADKTKLDAIDASGTGMTDAGRALLLPAAAGDKELAIKRYGTGGIDENTQSMLHFDTADGTWIDSANARTIVSTAAYSASGKFSGCAAFDGSQHIHLTASPSLAWGTGNGTVDAWVYGYDSPNSSNAILAASGYWNTGGISISFDRGGDQRFVVWIYDHQPSAASITSSHTFSRNAWHHVALVRDATTIKLFVNGALEGSLTVSSALSINWAGTGTYAAIGYNEADSQGFKGRIDELRISNTARWTAPFTPPVIPYTDAPAAWKSIGLGDLRNELEIPAPAPLLLDYALSGASVQLKIEASATADFVAVTTLIDTGLNRTAAQLWNASASAWIAYPTSGVSSGARVAVMMDAVDATSLKYLRYKWYAVEAATTYFVFGAGSSETNGSYIYDAVAGGRWIQNSATYPVFAIVHEGTGWTIVRY